MVDVDIRGYFDNIDHGRLMDLVSERVSDGEVLRLLQLWLDAEIVTEVESWNPIKGTPQGAVISPLLANIYLSGLDAHMTELAMFRFCVAMLARHNNLESREIETV